MSPVRRFLRRCVLVTALGLGSTYAVCAGLSERDYTAGVTGKTSIGERVVTLRQAARLFPFDRRFRTASAVLIANIALQTDLKDWKAAAVPELKVALATDPTQADLLGMLIAFDLALERTAEAQAYYDRFKQVAKNSPLPQWIADTKGEHHGE